MKQDLLFIHKNNWMHFVEECILRDLRNTVDIVKETELCETIISNRNSLELLSRVNNIDDPIIPILTAEIYPFSEGDNIFIQIVMSIDDKKTTYNIYELTIDKISEIVEANKMTYTLTDKVIAFFKKETLHEYNYKNIRNEIIKIFEQYSVRMMDEIVSKIYKIKYDYPFCGYKTTNEAQRLI